MQLIRHRGAIRALAGRDRYWLAPSIARLADDHPDRVHVRLMCRYAAAIARGELPGPYSHAGAETFARAALAEREEPR
jgi:hypothetical protein